MDYNQEYSTSARSHNRNKSAIITPQRRDSDKISFNKDQGNPNQQQYEAIDVLNKMWANKSKIHGETNINMFSTNSPISPDRVKKMTKANQG